MARCYAAQRQAHRVNQPLRKPPAYRTRPGYTQAIVTLTDPATKRRRDYWLGVAAAISFRRATALQALE